MACQTRFDSRSLTSGERLMVLETVAMDTLAAAATVRISGILPADLPVALRGTNPS
jgi:hypothetical protein